MPQPDKRSALQVLTKARLRELVGAFELTLAAAESKNAHVELLARSKKATLPKLLDQLLRDELKDICRAHGLADAGRDKAPISAPATDPRRAIPPHPRRGPHAAPASGATPISSRALKELLWPLCDRRGPNQARQEGQ